MTEFETGTVAGRGRWGGRDGLLLIGAFTALMALALWGLFRSEAEPWPIVTLVAALVLAAAAIRNLWRRTRHVISLSLDHTLLGRVLECDADALLVESLDGRVVFANARLKELLARPVAGNRQTASGGDLEDWLRSAGVTADVIAGLRGALGDGQPASALAEIRQDNGESLRYEIAVRPLDGGSRVWRLHRLGSRAAGANWTERAENHSEHAAVGFYTLDESGRFLFLNPTMAGWLGRSVPEVIESGARITDCVTAGETADPLRPGVVMVGIQCVGGLPRELQATHVVVDGPQGPLIHGVARPVGPGGAVAQRFQRLFREIPVGVALVDRRLRVGDCNASFREMVDDSDALGKPMIEFVSDDGRDNFAKELQSVLDEGTSAKLLEVRFKGAGEVAASIFVGRLQGDLDISAGLALLVIDNTEQKNLEAQLAQSQKMQAVGQLAGGIAHDFNNVLTAMIGFCDLLLQRHRPGDQSFADIMQIKQNANRAAALVRQLLAFSRQQTLQPRLLNVTEVLAELSNLLRRLLGEKIELSMVHGRDLGLIKGDQGQLEQVIINLAVNARDAMSSGGRLTIETRNVDVDRPRQAHGEVMPAGEYVQITIADTGVGIPRENFSRIFEPFFTTKEVGSGTGLGLSTVYGIVKQTGGYLFVDSAGEGRGALFDIYFKRQEPAVAEEEAPGSSEVATDLTGGGTVLLVEDEDPVRLFSARALRNKGYKVIEAKTGEAALELLNGGVFDLLVTDMVMPRVDGAAVIREARRRMPDLPVICISGYTEESVLNEVESLDQLRFLSKPFSLKQLATAVKESIETAERWRARASG